MKSKVLQLVFSAILMFALQGCGEEEGVGKYGMMEAGTPEYTAMRFLRHIYDDERIDGALSLSSPRMSRILKSYGTPRNAQRHVLSLTYDTVELELDAGDSKMRAQFADQARVTIYFSGMIHGDKKEELRSINLIRVGRDWKVDSIEDDPFK